MAVCKSPQHIFENQFPENQTLLESVMSSWSQNVVNPVKRTQGSSFSEVFGDLYSKDGLASQLHEQNLVSSSVDSSQMSTNKNQNKKENKKEEYPFSFPLGNNHYSSCSKIDIGFSLVKSESLQLCTEGLGSESSDDVEENFQVEMIKEEKMVSASVKHVASGTSSGELRRSRMSRQAFPPPLSFIGKSAKTGVRFTSYRQDGRFVLKEIRIPTQEFLQARREDGRLKLHIVQPNDYILEEDDEEFEEHDDDEAETEKIEEEN